MVLDIICFIGLIGVIGLAFSAEELSKQQKFREKPSYFDPYQNQIY